MAVIIGCQNEECEDYMGDRLTDPRWIRNTKSAACFTCNQRDGVWVYKFWREDHPADRYAPEGLPDYYLSAFRDGFDAWTRHRRMADNPHKDRRKRRYWRKGFEAGVENVGPRHLGDSPLQEGAA